MRIFPEPEVLLQQFEKHPELFTFYTCCANFSSLALKVASESWCVNNNNNNNKNNKNNSKEGTAESVKGQRAVAPLTLIIRKDKTKTERFPTKVGNLNNKKKQNKNRKVVGRPWKSPRHSLIKCSCKCQIDVFRLKIHLKLKLERPKTSRKCMQCSVPKTPLPKIDEYFKNNNKKKKIQNLHIWTKLYMPVAEWFLSIHLRTIS